MTAVFCRPARKEDLPAVGDLWARLDSFHRSLGLAFPEPQGAVQAWLDSFERTLGRFSFAWVAEVDGQICAFLLARVKRTPAYLGGVMVGEISDLYVDEALRGQRVGARLADMAVEHLQSLKVHSIEVQVLQKNDGALAFWQEMGFRPELVQLCRAGK